MWVKGHTGEKCKERADYSSKEAVAVRKVMHNPKIATPAGIRQKFLIHPSVGLRELDRQAVRGLAYMVRDRGPQRWWLHKIGKANAG